MYIYTTNLYTYIYIHIYIHMYIYVYIFIIHVNSYALSHTHIHKQKSKPPRLLPIRVFYTLHQILACRPAHSQKKHTITHSHTHTYIHTQTHKQTRIHKHIRTHTYTHAYTHAHAYTQTLTPQHAAYRQHQREMPTYCSLEVVSMLEMSKILISPATHHNSHIRMHQGAVPTHSGVKILYVYIYI